MYSKSNFIITTSFYPINKSKVFFGGMCFDNPKTDDEIKQVANILKGMNYASNRPVPENAEQVGEGVVTLKYIFEQMKFVNKKYKELIDFYEENKDSSDIYSIFAKMSVIIRFNDILDQEAIKKQCMIFINPEMMPISDEEKEEMKKKQEIAKKTPIGLANLNYELTNKLFTMLSFLSNNEYSSKFNLIYDEYSSRYEFLPIDTFISFFMFLADIKKENNSSYNFKKLMSEYFLNITLIDEMYKEKEFLYICESLSESLDIRFKNKKGHLVGVISLIEMLLTHKPKNMDDSIKSQFVNKNKYIGYLNNKNIDLKKAEKELSLVYDLRSDIAHGNFSNLKKIEEKLFQFYDLKQGNGYDYKDLDYVIEIVSESMKDRLKQILYIYFRDKNELELIKNI